MWLSLPQQVTFVDLCPTQMPHSAYSPYLYVQAYPEGGGRSSEGRGCFYKPSDIRYIQPWSINLTTTVSKSAPRDRVEEEREKTTTSGRRRQRSTRFCL